MFKKTLVVFLVALLMLMPLAQANGQPDNVDKVLDYIDEKINAINTSGEGAAINLLDMARRLYDAQILNTFFNNLNTDLKNRLDAKGITQDNIELAVETVRSDGFYGNTKGYINGEITRDDYKPIFQDEFNKVFKGNDSIPAPLKAFDDSVASSFGGWKSFLSSLKQLEIDLQGKSEVGDIVIEYRESTGKLSISSGSAIEIKNSINEKLLDELTPITETEVSSLINAANAVLAKLSSSDTATVKSAFGCLGYTVTTIPKSGGGGTGGDKTGGSGGGETTPETPEIVVPKETTKPVSVNVPAGAVSVSVSDGKAVVSLDSSTVNTILKLLDEATKTAKDKEKPLVLTIDLSTSKKITDNTEINLPASIIAKAEEVKASILVVLPTVNIEIPGGAVDLGSAENLVIVVQQLKPGKALEGITLPAGMIAVGNAEDIVIKTDSKNAKINGKITIYFNLKGITANTDKLGIYYVNSDKGNIEFVGGKVDKEAGTIRAEVSHFSTYVLIEYNKTFDDVRYHWAKNYVESMAAKHILDGKAENIFAPDDNMTRAEFAKIIVKTLNLDIKEYDGSFEDVSAGDWFADYVQTAHDNNLIQGKVAGKVFDPNGKITRQEMMTVIGRAMDKKASKDADAILGSYKDADKVADYAKDYIALLIEEKLVSGYTDNTLRPNNSITRAEAAKIIYGLYNYH